MLTHILMGGGPLPTKTFFEVDPPPISIRFTILRPSLARGRAKKSAPRRAATRPVATFTSSLVKQPCSFPRRECARVLKLNPHLEGWAERRQAHGCGATHPFGMR